MYKVIKYRLASCAKAYTYVEKLQNGQHTLHDFSTKPFAEDSQLYINIKSRRNG